MAAVFFFRFQNVAVSMLAAEANCAGSVFTDGAAVLESSTAGGGVGGAFCMVKNADVGK